MKNMTLVLTCALIVFACHKGDAQALARQLDSEFRAGVPPSAPKQMVVAFLTAHGIRMYEDTATRTLRASVPDVERHFLVRAGVYMSFRFDQQNRLKDYEIKAVATGL